MPETQKLSKIDRESQLQRMALTDRGRTEILEMYKRCAGISEESLAPPIGMTCGQMIDAIVAKEFPE